jgi:hypothetical protein
LEMRCFLFRIQFALCSRFIICPYDCLPFGSGKFQPVEKAFFNYTSMPSRAFASSPMTKEIAATPRLMAAISAKRRKNGSSRATEI